MKAKNSLVALSLLIACGPLLPVAHSETHPVYPLKVSANKRYLVDQNNKPFLIVADSPQGLIYRLTEKQAEDYFADRKAHGFNSMGWIDVLCAGRDYPQNTMAATPDGIRPFRGFVAGGTDWRNYDLSKPNEAYFVRLDNIVSLAAKQGLFIFLDPIETAGWLTTLRNNGLTAAYNYGQFLGQRYKKWANVGWLNGNDFAGWQKDSDDALVRAVSKGIRSVSPSQIQTVEFNPPTGSSLDDPTWAPLININGSYIYGPTYVQMWHSYKQKPVMPTFLMEAHYELENVGQPPDFGTPPVLRREEYWTMLSGGKGQFYGNKYTWSFVPGWEKNLDTPGVSEIAIWEKFFASLPWQDLVPDLDHPIITAGGGTAGTTKEPAVSKSDYTTAAKTPDGSVVVAYMPSARTITVNMASLKGPAKASWFDPTSGAYTEMPGHPFANNGSMQFTPPGKNHGGESDWVLLLDARK